MATPPTDSPDDADIDPEDDPFSLINEVPSWSFADAWHRAVDAIRSCGIMGRDAEVAACALAVARREAMGRLPPLLCIGSPGSGKSLLLKGVAAATGLHPLILHGPTLSPSGWEGLTLRNAIKPSANELICIEDIDTLVAPVDDRVTGNSRDRVSLFVGDLRSLAEGAFTMQRPPNLVATATLPRLRLPPDGSITAETLRAAGMDASIAPLWSPIYLGPLAQEVMREIITGHALVEAEKVEGSTGYVLTWSTLALTRLLDASTRDPNAGMRLGLHLIDRAINAALLSAVGMRVPDGGHVLIAPDHLPPTTPPPGPGWRDIERSSYG